MDRILIVGTHPLHEEYARWLLRALDHRSGIVHIVDSSTSAADAVRVAAKMARSQRRMGSECQQCWVILDGASRDEVEELQRVVRSPQVRVVSSSPDLRWWIAMHLADRPVTTAADLDRAVASLEPKLSRPLRHYEEELRGKFDLARSRALVLSGGPYHSNVHDLVESVMKSLTSFTGKPLDRPL